MYKSISFKVAGVAPLLMHNGQLADPMNRYAKALKAITKKRTKTEEDYEEMARIEFLGGLYVGENGEPVIPGEMIEATIANGAKDTKRGKVSKSAILVPGVFPLLYKGPKDAESLFDDDNHRYVCNVKVNQGRVMRTRPKFNDWSLEFQVEYLPDTLNPSDVVTFVETAGRIAGFGDGRPRFGRFNIEWHSEMSNTESELAAA